MKAAPFEYHRPESVEHATTLLAELAEAKVLAGGQSLVPMLALRLAAPDHLVDVSRLAELRGIGVRGDELWVGAGTPEAVVETAPQVRAAAPLLAAATPLIGHFQIRNRGTIGGSIAHADPAAEYPAVALALDAELDAASPRGVRTIPVAEFFTGVWSTALEPDELLVGIRFPVWGGRSGFAVRELARRHGDFAVAGAAVGVQLDDDDVVLRCAIGLFGLGPAPRRAADAERAALRCPVAGLPAGELGRLAVAGLDGVPSDQQGSAAYRRRVGAAMVARAWASTVESIAAVDRIGGGRG
jgi:aerobic carbon-monoxide dehydrogenase medium subunit